MKLSDKFTTMRIAFAPIFFLLYNVPLWFSNETLLRISAFLMIPLLAIFELTDFFDGFFARKKGEVSDFGKLFDPFADVMLNLTIFLCVTRSISTISYMPLLIFVFILYREFTMTFIRMVAISKGTAIGARKGGKLKTVFYITSGFFAILIESALRLGFKIDENILKNLNIVGIVLFSICLFLSYISFFDYIRTFYGKLKTAE